MLVQLVKYDVHTTRKIKSIHAIFYHILLFYYVSITFSDMDVGILQCCNLHNASACTTMKTGIHNPDRVSLCKETLESNSLSSST